MYRQASQRLPTSHLEPAFEQQLWLDSVLSSAAAANIPPPEISVLPRSPLPPRGYASPEAGSPGWRPKAEYCYPDSLEKRRSPDRPVGLLEASRHVNQAAPGAGGKSSTTTPFESPPPNAATERRSAAVSHSARIVPRIVLRTTCRRGSESRRRVAMRARADGEQHAD